MRPLRLLLTSLAAVVLAAVGLAGTAAGAAPGAKASPFFSESNKEISQDGQLTPIAGNFGIVGGPADIIWYAPGRGLDELWSSTNNGGFDRGLLLPQVDGTYTPLVGNFAGDAHDDIFWYGPGAAPDLFWTTTGTHAFKQSAVSISGTYTPIVIPDNFGHDDILWWNKSGASVVWSFTGSGSAHATHTVVAPGGGAKPLVGDFNGDGYGDIFWYAPGRAADAFWKGNGSGGFAVKPQTVNGTFTPIVHDFTPGYEGARDDILWYRANGASVLWQSLGAGTWSTQAYAIPAGKPVATDAAQGLIYIVRPGLPDWVWYPTPNGQYSQASHNSEVAAEAIPVVSNFVGIDNDIFWYRPGAGAEQLFFTNFLFG